MKFDETDEEYFIGLSIGVIISILIGAAFLGVILLANWLYTFCEWGGLTPMIKGLLTERWEFKLEMPLISWIVILGYLVADTIYRLLLIWKVMNASE